MSQAVEFEEAVEDRVPGIAGLHPQIHGISKHGWRRWCERAGRKLEARRPSKKVKEWNAKVAQLRAAIGRAVEVQLKPRYRVAALCNNGFEPARYYRSSGFVFVVSIKTGLVMTVHTGEARRWEPKRED